MWGVGGSDLNGQQVTPHMWGVGGSDLNGKQVTTPPAPCGALTIPHSAADLMTGEGSSAFRQRSRPARRVLDAAARPAADEAEGAEKAEEAGDAPSVAA